MKRLFMVVFSLVLVVGLVSPVYAFLNCGDTYYTYDESVNVNVDNSLNACFKNSQKQRQNQAQGQVGIVNDGDQTVIMEKELPNTPVAPNEYVGTHYEGRGEIVSVLFSFLEFALDVRCFRYDSWVGDKINWHEVHKVFLRERIKILKEWEGFDIEYIIVRHPRSVGAGVSLSSVYSLLSPNSGGTGGGMFGFTSVGEKDKFEIYFIKLTKTEEEDV